MKYVLLLCGLMSGLAAYAQQCQKGPDQVPLSRYRLQGALLLDTQTGLTWKRCAEGQNWTGKGCSGKPSTFTVSEGVAWVAKYNAGPAAARHGRADWRLPTHDELLTLVDSRCSDPAINLKAFPSTVPEPYWTGTSPGGTGQWAVHFGDGFDEIFNANRSMPLRLVRK